MSDKAKKILLISSNSSARGGGERYLVFMAAGLVSLGCEVHVLLSRVEYMDGWEKEMKEVGATVHRLPLRGLVHRPLRFLQSILDFKQQGRISEFCCSLAPDLIFVNQQYDEDGIDYLAGALKSQVCQVSGIIHMPMTKDKNNRPFGSLRGAILKHWYNSHPYDLVFSSDGGRKEFVDYYHPSFEPQVVLSGVPLSANLINLENTFKKLEDPWIASLYNETGSFLPVIGTVCQFVPQKNLSLLIDSWQLALEQGCEVRLLLIGDGPMRKEIEERLKGIDKSMWHITGWGDKYSLYMRHLDIFIMSSFYEGLPLALIEAVGMGIPTIISGVNGAQEVKDRADWVEIFNVSEVEVLATLIIDYSRRLPDLKDKAANGREQFIIDFSPENMARDLFVKVGIFNGDEYENTAPY